MVSSQTVAALYIDPRGPYPKMGLDQSDPDPVKWVPRVDCWDAERDARLYAGPHPVVAHPPCKHWGRLRHLAKGCDLCTAGFPKKAYTHYPTQALGMIPNTACRDDRDCAPRAVEQVRAFGGVLEHPAGSKLWEACGLPVPEFEVRQNSGLRGRALRISATRNTAGEFVDSFGGYTIELDQCEWGHVARKRTWLYLVGVPREALEAPPFPGREPTHYASGGRTASSRNGGAVPAGMKVCSAQQRRRTPPLFAEYLVRLARSVQK